jgi:hypothetical protein
MNRRPIWVPLCLALCGCQTIGGPVAPVLDDCPNISPCDDDPDTDARLLLSHTPGPVVIQADWRPPLPGCPTTLQVMARLHRDEPDETAPDPSDYVCEPPEAPLLRARLRSDKDLAVR